MLSRLRRLLAPPPPPAATPPERGGADWLQGQDPQRLRLIDARNPRAAAGGVVRGSWLLPAEQLLELPLPQDIDLALLCDDVDQAMRLATALRDRGLQVLVPHGRADLEAAGLIFHTPAWKSPLPPAHPIWLTEEGAGQLGLSGRLPGWVQDVRWPAFEFRYDALLLGPAGLLRLEDLPEEALASRGPRGAAGLGELS